MKVDRWSLPTMRNSKKNNSEYLSASMKNDLLPQVHSHRFIFGRNPTSCIGWTSYTLLCLVGVLAKVRFYHISLRISE
uniref:Putative ovule protein n=1 Tax=Solanum chacoense TaxID=4108 RepID=A0A0V0HZU9_SOLCH